MDGIGNDVSLFVNANVANTALALADALRAAALKYLPEQQASAPVVVAAEV